MNAAGVGPHCTAGLHLLMNRHRKPLQMPDKALV